MKEEHARVIVESIAEIAEYAAVVFDNYKHDESDALKYNTKLLEQRKAALVELLKEL